MNVLVMLRYDVYEKKTHATTCTFYYTFTNNRPSLCFALTTDRRRDPRTRHVPENVAMYMNPFP